MLDSGLVVLAVNRNLVEERGSAPSVGAADAAAFSEFCPSNCPTHEGVTRLLVWGITVVQRLFYISPSRMRLSRNQLQRLKRISRCAALQRAVRRCAFGASAGTSAAALLWTSIVVWALQQSSLRRPKRESGRINLRCARAERPEPIIWMTTPSGDSFRTDGGARAR
jgi:hypothetical protein